MQYFAHLGYPCPSHCNPADHLVDLVSTDYDSKVTTARDSARIEGLVNAWTRHAATVTAARDSARIEGLVNAWIRHAATAAAALKGKRPAASATAATTATAPAAAAARAAPLDLSSISSSISISSSGSIAADPEVLSTTLTTGALRSSGSS